MSTHRALRTLDAGLAPHSIKKGKTRGVGVPGGAVGASSTENSGHAIRQLISDPDGAMSPPRHERR